jgi:hypothetical protein
MSGQLTKAEEMSLDPEVRKRAEALSERLLKRIAPPGALGLPPLLESRRLEYGIIDEYFEVVATFEKVFVYVPTVAPGASKKFGDTLIEMPDTVAAAEAQAAPEGIIVSAGLRALDILESNGLGLGDIVTFSRGAIARVRCGWFEGVQQWVSTMYADDISGSRDLRSRIVSGECVLKKNAEGQSYYEWNGIRLPEPKTPDYHPNT